MSSNILDKMKQSPRIILRYFKINNLRYPVDAIIEIRDKIYNNVSHGKQRFNT